MSIRRDMIRLLSSVNSGLWPSYWASQAPPISPPEEAVVGSSAFSATPSGPSWVRPEAVSDSGCCSTCTLSGLCDFIWTIVRDE